MKTFREFINEKNEKYVIGLSDGESFLTKNFKFTDNIEFAYIFKSEKEAIQYEDDNANKIDGFTYLYKLKNNKVTKV